VVSTKEELWFQPWMSLRRRTRTEYGVRAEHVVATGDSGQLMQIVRLIDSGDVRPMVEMVMPLAKARRALEMSHAGHVRGKIVLRIRE